LQEVNCNTIAAKTKNKISFFMVKI